MRQQTKAIDHINMLQEAVNTHSPPRELIPRVNPWLSTTPTHFLVDWDKSTQTSEIKYTELLV